MGFLMDCVGGVSEKMGDFFWWDFFCLGRIDKWV